MTRKTESPLRLQTAIAAAMVVAIVAGVALVWPNSSGDRTAVSAEAEAYVLSAEPGATELPPVLDGARQVGSLEELKDAVAGPAVIVVDRSVAPSLGDESLRAYAAKGYALVGLNVPLDRLTDLAGFTGEITSINPEFGEHEPETATFEGDFFSVVWRTPADATTQRWSRGQQDLSPGLFATVLADLKLRSAGLARDDAGNLVPLEEYE